MTGPAPQGDDPAAADFAGWQRAALTGDLPVLLRTDAPERFTGTLRRYRLGLVTAVGVTCGPLTAERPAALVAAGPPCHQLLLPRRGLLSLELDDGRHVRCGPGSLVLGTASRPSTLRTHPEPGDTVTATALLVPHGLLSLSDTALEPLLATALPADTGAGALLGRLVHRLDAEAAHYRAVDADRLETVLLGLVASFLAPYADDGAPAQGAAPDGPGRALCLRAQELVLRELHDPGLTPARVAGALHISTRYLYRLFQEHEDLPVRAWIRRQRLERCARALADPAERGTPVHALAARWGFSHPAAFSRAFRDAYGLSPDAYRRAHAPRAAPDM